MEMSKEPYINGKRALHTWQMGLVHDHCWKVVFLQCNVIWSKEPPHPRGGFLFTMFPDQEPGVRGLPSNNLNQVLWGGSSCSAFLIREHKKMGNPPRGGGKILLLHSLLSCITPISADVRSLEKVKKEKVKKEKVNSRGSRYTRWKHNNAVCLVKYIKIVVWFNEIS